MGKPLTFFSNYNSSENRTTNYTLLLLKLIYEDSPTNFGYLLSTLTNEETGSMVGVKFYQQEKKNKSIPDGIILQKSFSIFIEAKNFDWFYDEQIENHLQALNDESANVKILIALSNFESTDLSKFDNIRNIISTKYKNQLIFQALNFEDFIIALEADFIPSKFKEQISEYRDYLNENNLLPTWKKKLDVINCAGIPEEILEGNVYLCPAIGGSYSHQRCKYFGMYIDKTVKIISEIKAVIDVNSADSINIKWINNHEKVENLKELALAKANFYRQSELPVRVFILDKLFECNFVKDSPGGIQYSKTYFDISKLNFSNTDELAKELSSKKWSDFNH
ncbi:hypothetical protein [Leptospira meyeri]|uniref:hypothetical protein n=1 Tax=Leptospira meyeri TaxID=29508 RepID=UPI0002BE6BFD|nr:hypothetical protein [Leptospira meyeri]EMJ85439.1 hypothetical protein LEP1GSC196_2605 [Leptospira meyeri serovar Semaranga str. Veldrot Semarang 173]